MRVIFKCDECGRFISLKDIESGKARHNIVTVDTEFSIEEYETLCFKCKTWDEAIEKNVKESC